MCKNQKRWLAVALAFLVSMCGCTWAEEATTESASTSAPTLAPDEEVVLLTVDEKSTPTPSPNPTETPAPTESTEPTGSPEPTENTESTASPDPTESTESTASPDPTESTEPSASPHPMESTDPTASPDPAESTEPTGSPEPTESTEPTGSPEPTESIEPTGSPDPTESTEPTASPDPDHAIYSVNVDWGSLIFTWGTADGVKERRVWDPENHVFSSSVPAEFEWLSNGNNIVQVSNSSSSAVVARAKAETNAEYAGQLSVMVDGQNESVVKLEAEQTHAFSVSIDGTIQPWPEGGEVSLGQISLTFSPDKTQ